MKALIVDDEEEIGMLVSRFLIKEGLEVAYASRVGKARSLIHNEVFGIYFLDLSLPDGTGFDLIPDIRAQTKNANVVVISAHDGKMETDRAVEMGVNLFIKKPFTKKQIVDAVNSIR